MKNGTINTGGFYIWFGDKHKLGKITIGTAEDGFHYTILINEYKRVINIHKTIESDIGKKYEQLFEMSFYTFYRFAVLFNKIELSLLQQYWLSQKINIGKFGRHDLILFPFTDDENVAKNFIDNKRPKKLCFKREIPIDSIINRAIFPDELPESKGHFFCVFSTKRGKCKFQGFIFRFSTDSQTRSFFFVSKKNFAKYKREIAATLFNVLRRLEFKHKEQVLQFMAENINERMYKPELVA